MATLRAVEVTPENFAPFGTLLVEPHRPPDLELEEPLAIAP